MPAKGMKTSDESKAKMRQAKLGKKMSEEFKQKRSEIMKQRWKDPSFKKDMSDKHSGENNANFGKPMSEEQRKKISEFAKNRTDGHIEKLCLMNIGKTHTEETKQKMSAAHSGKPFTEEHKRRLKESYHASGNAEKHSDRMIKLWNTNSFRTSVCSIHKERCKGSDGHYNMRDLVKRRWEIQQEQDMNNLWYGNIRYYQGPQYCEKWTEELKERVRAYFGYQCAECGTPQNGNALHVHHVWYNKRLCCDDTPRSLVPLCSSCHSKTNTNRDYWSEHFQEIIDVYYEGKCWFTKEEMKCISDTQPLSPTSTIS